MVYKYSELNLTQNVYTFSKITDGVLTDASLTKDGKTYNNKIKTSFRTDGYQQVPQEIVFINCDRCNNNELIDCYKLTFGYVTKDSYSAEAVRNKLIDCSYSYFNNINSSTMYICTDIYVEKVLYGCYAFNSSYIKKTDSWTYKLEIEKVRGKSSNYITIPSIGVTYNNISHVLRLETTYDNKIILKWKTGTGTEVGKYLDSNADTEWKDIPSSSVLYKHFITAYVGSDKTIYFTLYSSSKTEMTKQYLQNTFNTKEPIHCWCDDTDWGYQYNCIMIKDFYQVDGNFHLEMIQMTDDETPHRNGWTFKFTDSVCTVTDVVTPM